MVATIECPVCGVEIESREEDGLFTDGDEYRCGFCDARLGVSTDSESPAYFNLIECAHGRDSETECTECENL